MFLFHQPLVRGAVLLSILLLATVSQAARVLRGGGSGRVLQASTPSITSLQLIQASTDRQLLSIQDGQTIYLGSLLPVTAFSIQAVAAGSVGSVRFAYNGNPNYRTENTPPYAFCGGSRTSYTACTVLGIGSHTVTATPYTADNAAGTAGTARTVRFTIAAGLPPTGPVAPVAPPVPAPVPAPVAVVMPPGTPRNCPVPRLVGDWEDYVEYPLPIAESQGGIIARDLVVLSGFSERWENATPRCYAYNLDNPNAVWRRMDDLPIARGLTHGAVVIVGPKAYLCGGFIGGHPGPHTDVCFVYDHSIAPGSGRQWSSLPPLPEPRSGGGLDYSKTLNALIYSGGAKRDRGYEDFPHTWIHVLGSNGWVRKADSPFLSNHKSYVSAVDNLGNERLFFLGGQQEGDESDGNVDDNYEYNPVNDVWTRRADMPFARGHANSSTRAVSCGFIIMAGTRNGIGKTRDISYYDIPSNRWTSIGNMDGNVNTPVCDIDFANGYLYCETGRVSGSYSSRIRIVV